MDAIDLPPGVEVTAGGVFEQIAEGFEDIFLAMATGVVLVYLVMVASLGSLRNPFIIVMSLPLALIGVLVSLAVTGRTLGLPAMMGGATAHRDRGDERDRADSFRPAAQGTRHGRT